MTLPQLFALDLIAISVLVFAVYFPATDVGTWSWPS